MDFSPSSDGKFYDSPEGTEGRTEVKRVDNPEGMVALPDSGSNADNKITDKTSTGKLYANQTEKDLYVAYSNGGASGAEDDYCVKSVDASSTNSYTAGTRINFPKTYGGTKDSSHKYRFEMDWKWQAYSNTTTATDAGSPTGATILTFYIGEKRICLNTKNSTEKNDARGGGAFYFQGYNGLTGFNSAFGLIGST